MEIALKKMANGDESALVHEKYSKMKHLDHAFISGSDKQQQCPTARPQRKPRETYQKSDHNALKTNKASSEARAESQGESRVHLHSTTNRQRQTKTHAQASYP